MKARIIAICRGKSGAGAFGPVRAQLGGGEEARLAVTLGGAAFAGRAMILAQREQGRLFGPGRCLGVSQGYEIAPVMAAAVDLDGAGEGHRYSSSPASASSLSQGQMCLKPQLGQSSSTWHNQVSDHS